MGSAWKLEVCRFQLVHLHYWMVSDSWLTNWKLPSLLPSLFSLTESCSLVLEKSEDICPLNWAPHVPLTGHKFA